MKSVPQILALLLLAVFTTEAHACPTCKSALHDGLVVGYAISILFMMAMPFAIFAFWIVTIWRLRNQAISGENELVLEELAFENSAR